jgi:hypothetical protein
MLVRIDSLGNPLKTFVVGVNASGSNTGEFIINDLGTEVSGPGNRRMTIDNNGNIGVGITSPTQKLHVAGNIAIQAGADAFIGTVDNYNLSLRTNNTDRVVISASGNVGIGVASPTQALHVSGVVKLEGSEANLPGIGLYSVSGVAGNVGIGFILDNTWIGGIYIDQTTKNLKIFNTTGGFSTPRAIAIFPYSASNAEGQITMAISDPVHSIYKTDFPSGWYGGLGTYNITCSGIYYDTLTQRSDADLKTDVQSLVDYLNTDSLDVISCLKPIKYVYVDDPLKANRFGFIAQDVSEVCPELVTIDTEGKASLNYMDLIALLTQGIQELYEMLGKVIQKIGGIS